MRNPKSEYRNPKQIQNSNFKNLILFRISILVFSILFFISNISFSAGQAGLTFDVLNAGVGARALGMGGAFTSIADDASAPYWNSAGLSEITSQEITTMQTKLSPDTDHYFISYVSPFLKGAVGFSWVQVSLGNITQTTTTDGFNEVITTNVFNYFSNAFMLSYGQELNSIISIGLTAKYLTSDMVQIGGGQASGYSVTPGILFRIPHSASRITLGAKIDDILNEKKWGTGTIEKSNPKARVGISYKELKGLLAGSVFALDIAQELKSNYSPEMSLGCEWSGDDMSLRLGWMSDALTAGAGFRSGVAQLDYAYVQQTNLSRSNVHRISLSGKW